MTKWRINILSIKSVTVKNQLEKVRIVKPLQNVQHGRLHSTRNYHDPLGLRCAIFRNCVIFSVFGPYPPTSARMEVKFVVKKSTFHRIIKFHPHRCNLSPLREENLKIVIE